MNREEFREQMQRCQTCGQWADGGCCPPPPLAVYTEVEYDSHVGPMEYNIAAVQRRDYFCLDCAREEGLEEQEVTEVHHKRDLLDPLGHKVECCSCGEALS